MQTDLSIQFIGLTFKNPIWIGACDATRAENVDDAIASGAGAVVLKSISELTAFQQNSITRFLVLDETQKPAKGVPKGNYTFFSRGGALQSVDEVLERMPDWRYAADTRDVRLIGSVNAGTLEGWVQLSTKLVDAGVDALELNFGNPHARHTDHMMGLKISQSHEWAAQIVRSVIAATGVPILVKLSPHAPDFQGLSQSVYNAGAAGITIMHRFQGLMLDVETGRPIFNGYNGVGGPWMKPLALYWLSKVHNEVGCPIVGGNGVDSWNDAAEFLLAGAGSIQVSSGVMVRGYGLVEDLLNGLEHYLQKRGISQLVDIVGEGARFLRNTELVTFPHRSIKVDTDICSSCKDKPCQDSCFFGALFMGDVAPSINDNCNGCGMCVSHCPYDDALTFMEHSHIGGGE